MNFLFMIMTMEVGERLLRQFLNNCMLAVDMETFSWQTGMRTDFD